MPFHLHLDPPTTPTSDHRALIDIEHAQRCDPNSLGRGDSPDRPRRSRWAFPTPNRRR